jgi:hypothetical protein
MASMSILDDAIREHLELKRAHGADEVELKKLEDEAFGPPGRPDDADPFAEAPTEFLGTAVEDAPAEPEGGRPMPNITDLQEPPTFPKEEEPAEEQEPAMEHQTIPVPHPEPPVEDEAPAGPAAEVADEPAAEGPEAIADQPTEFFDVEAELQAEAAGVPEAEKPSPTDEQLLDSQLSEPRLAPAEPIEPLPSEELELPDEAPSDEYEDEDDFFSEQRLSEELHQALDEPVTGETEALPEPQTPPPPADEATAIYDIEENEDAEEDSGEHSAYEPDTASHDDVLEDTPDFLEDAPEDDDLWFEQRPPKDFDFDD